MDLESSETLSRPSQVDGAIKKEIPFKTRFSRELGTSEFGRRNGEVTSKIVSNVYLLDWKSGTGSSRLLAARTVIDAMCE